MKSTRLAIVGAAGRMGGALVRCAQRMDNVEVTAALDLAGHPQLGADAGVLAGIGDIGVLVTDDHAALEKADVLIDFSLHEAVPATLAAAVERRLPVVLGTTGLNASETAQVREAAQTLAVLHAPNMSVGMNLLFAMVRQAAASLDTGYDAEVVETHHRHKKDAPSGTALLLAEQVAAGRKAQLEEAAVYGRHGVTGERPAGQIGIHAVRAGDTVGDHTVLFATDGERLEFSHRATSRDAFAMGALRAAVWIRDRKPGLYDMQNMLGL